MVGGLRDVITCAEFQIKIFMGYDFKGGQIFDFPFDFSMGLTTVQRYCAACDCARRFVLLKLTTDRHEVSRGLFATAELLVWSKLTTCFRHLHHSYIISTSQS